MPRNQSFFLNITTIIRHLLDNSSSPEIKEIQQLPKTYSPFSTIQSQVWCLDPDIWCWLSLLFIARLGFPNKIRTWDLLFHYPRNIEKQIVKNEQTLWIHWYFKEMFWLEECKLVKYIALETSLWIEDQSVQPFKRSLLLIYSKNPFMITFKVLIDCHFFLFLLKMKILF